MNKIFYTIICLIFLISPKISFSEYPGQNNSNPEIRFRNDSTVVIIDSLISNEAHIKKWQNGLIAGLSLASLPLGIANGVSLVLIPQSLLPAVNMGKAALLIPFGYVCAHPGFIVWSTYDILRKEAKQRLLKKYEGFNIIDSSSIKSKYIPSYSIFLGANYATFLTDDVKSKVNYSCGIRYDYKLTRYLSLATAMQISKRNISVNNKIYRNHDVYQDGEYHYIDHLIDITFNTFEVYCPIYLKFSIDINDKQSLYVSVGTGFPIYLPISTSYTIKETDHFSDYDYNGFDDGFFPTSDPMYSFNIGLSGPKYFYEFEMTQDYNYSDLNRIISKKGYNPISFTEKFIAFQFIIGYKLPIR
ncbi:MAG: hypothetical protein V1681_01480 [Candidatus Neomarinimicrobiota bacterium]